MEVLGGMLADQGQLETDEQQPTPSAAPAGGPQPFLAQEAGSSSSGGGGGGGSKKPMPEQRRRCMSDKFMMYTYKIKLCKRQDPHNWRLCPYAHPGEAGKRRPPPAYQAIMCDFSKTRKECSHGEACLLARNALEYWLHPDKYRTILCGHGEACSRNICFFAHNQQELRAPGAGPDSAAAGEADAYGSSAVAVGAAAEALHQLSISGAGSSQAGAQLVYVAQPGGTSGTGLAYAAGAAAGSQTSFSLQQPAEAVVGAHQQQQQLVLPVDVAGGSPTLQAAPGFQAPPFPQRRGVLAAAPGMYVPQQQLQPGVPAQLQHYDYDHEQQPMPPPPARHALLVQPGASPLHHSQSAAARSAAASAAAGVMPQPQHVFEGWQASHGAQQQQQLLPGEDGPAGAPYHVALPLAAMSGSHVMVPHPGGVAHPAMLYQHQHVPYAQQPFQQQQFHPAMYGFQAAPPHPQMLVMAPPGSTGVGAQHMLMTLPPGAPAAAAAAPGVAAPEAAAAAAPPRSPRPGGPPQYGMHLPHGNW